MPCIVAAHLATTTDVSPEVAARRKARFQMHQQALSLKDFTLRAQILNLYRRYMRSVKHLPPHSQPSAKQQIQQAFREHGSLQQARGRLSAADRKALLSDGERQLKYLSSYVATAADNKLFEGSPVVTNPDELQPTGHDDDVRGRIGKDWPWQ